MSERTSGGLFLPNEEVIQMLERDEVPAGTEPTASADGLTIDAGYASGYFVTDPAAWIAELDRPWVILFDGDLIELADVIPTCERAAREARAIFIAARSLSLEVTALLVANKLRGILYTCAIATLRTQEIASHVGRSELPEATRVVCGKTRTVIETSRTLL